jgi:hypothetical protein
LFQADHHIPADLLSQIEHGSLSDKASSNADVARPNAEKFVTGKDWQREDLQQKYRGLFSWYLQQKIAVIEAGKRQSPSVYQ